MLIYKSKFLEVNYLELQYLIHINWMEFASFMDSEGVYKEYVNFLEKRIYKRGNQIYVDWRKIEKLISQETIDWFLKHILPKIVSHKPYRLAFLFNYEKLFQVQDKVKIGERFLEIKSFSNPNILMKWLMDGAERKPSGLDDHEHNDSCKVN